MPTNAPDGLINSAAVRGGLKTSKGKAAKADPDDTTPAKTAGDEKPAPVKASTVTKSTAKPK